MFALSSVPNASNRPDVDLSVGESPDVDWASADGRGRRAVSAVSAAEPSTQTVSSFFVFVFILSHPYIHD